MLQLLTFPGGSFLIDSVQSFFLLNNVSLGWEGPLQGAPRCTANLFSNVLLGKAATPVKVSRLQTGSVLTALVQMVHLCPQQGPRRGFLYINVCSWKRVPAPQDPSRPLPVFAGKLETETKEGQGESWIPLSKVPLWIQISSQRLITQTVFFPSRL